MWKFITDPKVGNKGTMTKRVKRVGGGEAAKGQVSFTAAEDMPLMVGISRAA